MDAADELAFLALDCERLGAPEVGRWFLDVHSEGTGDPLPRPLLGFYRTYRAMRRAVIALWHLDDDYAPDPALWRPRALRYLELAEEAPV